MILDLVSHFRYGFELQGRAILVDDVRVHGTGRTNILRCVFKTCGVRLGLSSRVSGLSGLWFIVSSSGLFGLNFPLFIECFLMISVFASS
jgi:hypothetical protein